MLYAAGCRISEALTLTTDRVDLAGRVIVIESMKQRRRGVCRAVLVPPELLDLLDWCTTCARPSGVARPGRCSGPGAA